MEYDVCIIGAGWAGFNAALKSARLGKKVCVVEERELGGTCLNRGCIPTKAFVFHSKAHLPLTEIQKKKDDVVRRLRAGMDHLVKTNKVDFLQGRAVIRRDGSVSVGPDKTIRAKYILIATGSAPKELPALKFDHKKILSSDDMLVLADVPKRLLVIGGGFIGCEFASIFKRLGSDVVIVEATQQLLPGSDSQTAKKLLSIFQKNGIQVSLGVDAGSLNFNDYDKVLLSVGRKAVIEGLWEEGVGIKIEKGLIVVDRELRTGSRNIFAAGDCIGGYMLAHVAAYEGELAVNNMFLRRRTRDYSVIPSSVFTQPEVASVGITEEEAKSFGANYRSAVVHFLSVGMAHIHGETEGFAKVLVDKKSGRILGVSIIGPEASELINIFSVIIKNNVTVKALKETIFAHPSISEIVAELAKVLE